MRYPLHTTADLACLPLYLENRYRRAVWVHLFSDDDRAWAIEQCEAAGGWEILTGLPIFFLVAVRPTVPPEARKRLVAMIRPSQSSEEIRFLGALFDYHPEEIIWFIEQSSC